MAQSDYFGYTRQVKPPGTVLTGDYATLSLGAGRTGLVARAAVNYAHEVRFFREIGSADAYTVTGNPMGTLQAMRGVGPEGMFRTFKPARCGFISALAITLDGKGNCAEIKPGKGVQMRNAVVQSVGFSIEPGKEITEDMNCMFTLLQV